MTRLPIAAAAVLLASCTTTFTDASKLPCKVTHRIEGDKLIATATMTNESRFTVTLVDHPDFSRFHLEAVTPTKQKLVKLNGLIHFIPATRKDLIRVRPGGQATLVWHFPIQKSSEVFEWSSPLARKRTWDTHVRIRFDYGSSSDYLPKHAWALGTNYVMTDLKAEEAFPRPH